METEKNFNEEMHNDISKQRIINEEFSKRLCAIAGDVNYACGTGQWKIAKTLMVELYNATNSYDSKKLLTIKPGHAQCIGLGYTWFATSFNNGNTDVNDVAAENALLCLAMSYIEEGNAYTLPAIFTLLNKYDERLDDAIERVLKSSFYYGANPEGYYKYNIDGYKFYRYTIMYFSLNKFYDIKDDKFIISPDDLPPYFLPTVEEIHNFLLEIKRYSIWEVDGLEDLGYDNLVRIYQSIFEFIKYL